MEGFDGSVEVEAGGSALSRQQTARRLDLLSNWGVISFILALLLVIVAQSLVLALQAVS